ncbi:hypothetical protein HWV62_37047, partial [Athelia sp. TMB]
LVAGLPPNHPENTIEFSYPRTSNDSRILTRLGVYEPSSKSVDACVAALGIDGEVLEARKTLAALALSCEAR